MVILGGWLARIRQVGRSNRVGGFYDLVQGKH